MTSAGVPCAWALKIKGLGHQIEKLKSPSAPTIHYDVGWHTNLASGGWVAFEPPPQSSAWEI